MLNKKICKRCSCDVLKVISARRYDEEWERDEVWCFQHIREKDAASGWIKVSENPPNGCIFILEQAVAEC